MQDKKVQQKPKQTLASKLNAGLKSARSTTANLNAAMATKKSATPKSRESN